MAAMAMINVMNHFIGLGYSLGFSISARIVNRPNKPLLSDRGTLTGCDPKASRSRPIEVVAPTLSNDELGEWFRTSFSLASCNKARSVEGPS